MTEISINALRAKWVAEVAVTVADPALRSSMVDEIERGYIASLGLDVEGADLTAADLVDHLSPDDFGANLSVIDLTNIDAISN